MPQVGGGLPRRSATEGEWKPLDADGGPRPQQPLKLLDNWQQEALPALPAAPAAATEVH